MDAKNGTDVRLCDIVYYLTAASLKCMRAESATLIHVFLTDPLIMLSVETNYHVGILTENALSVISRGHELSELQVALEL